jgi:hypothetical protein
MQRSDRIEARRFVGREFLLFLWFESELFDGTLQTRSHGSFGLWLERRIVLSAAKEVTQIKGAFPAGGKEAKEALMRGKLPELAGIHVSFHENEITFILKAEALAFSGLSLSAVLEKDENDGLPEDLTGSKPRNPRKGTDGREGDLAHEAFYDRMQRTREIEEILEALYQDFLTLRLGPAWESLVTPMIKQWLQVDDVSELDTDGYRSKRSTALAGKKRRSA